MPPTLPKSCEVEALRVWVNDVWLTAPHDGVWGTMARAVRALLDAKCREVALAVDARFKQGPMMVSPGESIEAIVARVLGVAK
jgi:hypothetical protein